MCLIGYHMFYPHYILGKKSLNFREKIAKRYFEG